MTRVLAFRTKALAIFTFSILLLAGCGNSKPEASLIKSCEELNKNLILLKSAPNLFKASKPSEKLTENTADLYYITNIGNETRQRNKEEMLKKYPFLATSSERAMYFTELLENDMTFTILTEAIRNTGFKISLTQAEINSIKGDFEDPSYKLVRGEIDRIIGTDLYDEDDNFIGHSGCQQVSSFKYEQNQEDPAKFSYNLELDDSDLLWSRANNAVEWAYEVIQITNICQKTGRYSGRQCASNDYVSENDFSFEAPAPVDPWSRTWSSRQQEEMAKSVWCIRKGYRNYNYSKDVCSNELSR